MKCGEHYYSTNMTLEEIKQIVSNKLAALNDQKNLAYMNGDLIAYANLEEQITETQKIIDKLNA
jgi:precorrin-4 methylase